MNKLIVTALMATLIVAPAHADDHKEERVSHYAAAEIKTTQDAQKELRKAIRAVGDVLRKYELDSNDMEKIHQISYTMEAAVKQFEKDKVGDVKALGYAVHELHEASEDHKGGETEKWFSEVKKEAGPLL